MYKMWVRGVGTKHDIQIITVVDKLDVGLSQVLLAYLNLHFPLYLEYSSKNSSKLISKSSLIILRRSPLGISLFPCTGTVVALPSSDLNLT